jgi:hypothetical protein
LATIPATPHRQRSTLVPLYCVHSSATEHRSAIVSSCPTRTKRGVIPRFPTGRPLTPQLK